MKTAADLAYDAGYRRGYLGMNPTPTARVDRTEFYLGYRDGWKAREQRAF